MISNIVVGIDVIRLPKHNILNQLMESQLTATHRLKSLSLPFGKKKKKKDFIES